LSQAVGKTTKRVVTRSRAVGRNPFEGRSVSERTEDTPLLTEDEARRMDLDEVILVIDAQMPIRARRVKYFEDPALKVLHAGQSGSFPYPDEDGLRRDRQMSETRETVERLKQELQEVRAAAGPREVGTNVPNTLTMGPVCSGRSRGRAARAAASGGGQGQLSLDIEGLGISSTNRTELASAIQTTRAIIAEHG
jgi:type IV secretion system protein VirD4